MRDQRFVRKVLALVGAGLVFWLSARGESATNQFQFSDYLLAPLRVHLLSSEDSPAIHTTLTERDIARILGKLNGVWSQAGLHFYLESLVREPANQQENYVPPETENARSVLLKLRPAGSQAENMFHVYYVKEMMVNGIYFPEAIFVKDTASLRKVEGGIDEPLPRVTSHELGHALGLSHRQNTTNLMASGTTGTWLSQTEIDEARAVAGKLACFESAPEVIKKADALLAAKHAAEATRLYGRLATLPLKTAETERARQRLAEGLQVAPSKSTSP
jgi:hypothetical protein